MNIQVNVYARLRPIIIAPGEAISFFSRFFCDLKKDKAENGKPSLEFD